MGHSWRGKDELISDVVQWTPTHGRASVGRPTRTYLQQVCVTQDVVWRTCRERWMIGTDGKRVWDIRAGSATWWYIYIYIYIYIRWRWVLFFFWPTDCISLDFFQLVWQGWLFLSFCPMIFFLFPPGGDSRYFYLLFLAFFFRFFW